MRPLTQRNCLLSFVAYNIPVLPMLHTIKSIGPAQPVLGRLAKCIKYATRKSLGILYQQAIIYRAPLKPLD